MTATRHTEIGDNNKVKNHEGRASTNNSNRPKGIHMITKPIQGKLYKSIKRVASLAFID